MKTRIAIVVLVFGCSFANAQHIKETEVPSKVKEGFIKKYPCTKVDVWEKEGADFEAEFTIDKRTSSAVFDKDGAFKEYEQKINVKELPAKATRYCAELFAEYHLSEAAKISNDHGLIYYEAELKKGKEHFDLLFDDGGNFIKKIEPSADGD